jgi:predicted dehydrogenase
MNSYQPPSRRSFLTSAGAAAAAPLFLPRRVFGANDRISIGVIGVGGRANLLIDQLPEPGQVVAVADCYLMRCEKSAAKRNAKWRLYQDYRKLLEQKDIDAVIVATTDHGRVLPCIHACQAGKDVYAEKPLTIYIAEGRVLVKAARKYKRIFQVGTQQRSMAMNRLACDFVRNGGLGQIKLVQGVNYTRSKRYTSLPEEPVPEKLDWDMWVGQTPMRPYNKKLQFGWMGWWDYSGGETTNWGAHGLDQVQSALGMDGTGPVELWPIEGGPQGAVAFRYANGVEVRLELPPGSNLSGGAVFTGEKGKIEIIRNNFKTDPPRMVKNLPPKEEVQKWRDDVALWQARYHLGNWLECIQTRHMPLADVEIGHRTISLCHLINITRDMDRRLHWDPKKERFQGDKEANRMLTRPRRKGFELPSKI